MTLDVSHLPHPLAILRVRAENEKSPRGRHDAAYLLWEAGLRMLAAVLLAEYQNRPRPCPNLTQPLGGLRGPSTGHWRAIVRELLPLLSTSDDDPPLLEVAYRLGTKRSVRDMPTAAALAHAIETKLRPERGSQPKPTVKLAQLFDDIVTYRHEVRAHGGLGDDLFFQHISELMLAGLDEIFASVDVLCGRSLVRRDHPNAAPMMGLSIPDWSGSQPNEFTELEIRRGNESLSISPWIYWNEHQGEMAFFNGFGGGHQKQALYLSYVSGAKTRQSSHRVVELIGRLREYASSEALSPWVPDFDELVPEADDQPIDRLGDFQLLELIGEGGMGKVYRAFQPSLERIVALKVMRDPHDEVAVKRFDREIQSLAKVDHPNLVKIYDSGVSGEDYFYTMEFVEGDNLAASGRVSTSSSAASSSRAEIRQIAQWMMQVASATEVLNQNGVIHRDIKPANIMVDSAGDRAVLLDLGLAHKIDSQSDLTRTQQFIGTLRYSSPEQATGKSVDARSDVYSLGATLWELLTEELIFGDDPETESIAMVGAICEKTPTSPDKINEGVPFELASVVLKCLEKEPSNRYESASMLAEDLGHWLENRPVQARQRTAGYRAKKFVRRQSRSLTIALALAISVALVAGLVVRRTNRLASDKVNAEAGLTVLRENAELETLLNAATEEVPGILNGRTFSQSQQKYLKNEISGTHELGTRRRLNAAMAMLAHGNTYVPVVCRELLYSPVGSVDAICDCLRPHSQQAQGLFLGVLTEDRTNSDINHEAAKRLKAVMAYAMVAEAWDDNDTLRCAPLIPQIFVALTEEIKSDAERRLVLESFFWLKAPLDAYLRHQFHHPEIGKRVAAGRLLRILHEDDAEVRARLMLAAPSQSQASIFLESFPERNQKQPGSAAATPAAAESAIDTELEDYLVPRSAFLQADFQFAANWVLNTSGGFVASDSFEDFLVNSDALRGHGFRPRKVRPFRKYDKLCISASFVRDARQWFFGYDLTADQIHEFDSVYRQNGYAIVDITAYRQAEPSHSLERYCGIWVQVDEGLNVSPTKISAGLSQEAWQTEADELLRSGWQLRSLQTIPAAFTGPDSASDLVVTSLFEQVGGNPNSFSFDWQTQAALEHDQASRQAITSSNNPIVDVAMVQFPREESPEAFWKQVKDKAEPGFAHADADSTFNWIWATGQLGQWQELIERTRGAVDADMKRQGNRKSIHWQTVFFFRSLAYLNLRDLSAAKAESLRLYSITKADSLLASDLRQRVLIANGNHLEVLARLQERLESDDPTSLYEDACVACFASDFLRAEDPVASDQWKRLAIALLDRAIESGWFQPRHLDVDLDLRAIRESSEFKEIQTKMREPRFLLVRGGKPDMIPKQEICLIEPKQLFQTQTNRIKEDELVTVLAIPDTSFRVPIYLGRTARSVGPPFNEESDVLARPDLDLKQILLCWSKVPQSNHQSLLTEKWSTWKMRAILLSHRIGGSSFNPLEMAANPEIASKLVQASTEFQSWASKANIWKEIHEIRDKKLGWENAFAGSRKLWTDFEAMNADLPQPILEMALKMAEVNATVDDWTTALGQGLATTQEIVDYLVKNEIERTNTKLLALKTMAFDDREIPAHDRQAWASVDDSTEESKMNLAKRVAGLGISVGVFGLKLLECDCDLAATFKAIENEEPNLAIPPSRE